MRTKIEIIVLVCMMVVLYFNLTYIPKQDYIHNNPWSQTRVSGPLIKQGIKNENLDNK